MKLVNLLLIASIPLYKIGKHVAHLNPSFNWKQGQTQGGQYQVFFDELIRSISSYLDGCSYF